MPATFPDSSALALTRYYDQQFGMDAVKVMPGEYFVTSENLLITTILGSCVSVCLYDSQSGIGGMNHYLLPAPKPLAGQPAEPSPRFGDCAMPLLIEHLLRLGARRERLQAKAFGGADVLQGMLDNRIGPANVSFVLDYLDQAGIPLVAQDLLESYPRKLFFFPSRGEVLLKKIGRILPLAVEKL